MPTYDYECQKCGHKFEVFHGMSENPKQKCSVCGAAAKKLIGGGLGIIFKGSGFYVTDSKAAGSSGKSKSSQTETAGSNAAENTGPAASGASGESKEPSVSKTSNKESGKKAAGTKTASQSTSQSSSKTAV